MAILILAFTLAFASQYWHLPGARPGLSVLAMAPLRLTAYTSAFSSINMPGQIAMVSLQRRLTPRGDRCNPGAEIVVAFGLAAAAGSLVAMPVTASGSWLFT